MKKTIFLFLFCFFYNNLLSQNHDYIWLFGYDSNNTNLSFGGSVIDFNENNPSVFYEYRDMNFDATNASISNFNGEDLLFYTNGISISNYNHQTIENGDGLNPGQYTDNHIEDGIILEQGVLIIPHPINSNLYYLLHEPKEYPIGNISLHCTHLYYSLIDMSLNNGNGAVIEKNAILVQDTLTLGKMTATKHANGRDWWVLVREYNTNKYYRILIDASGIHLDGVQEIGMSTPSPCLGQAVFSPDGKKYIRVQLYDIDEGNYIDIYDFDRCTGLLSNQKQNNYVDWAWSGGCAISPNSRYLYVSSYHYVYQYDLHADDIFASKDTVAIYDGYEMPLTPEFGLPTRFFLCQAAPDGKIYISCTNGVNVLHVINKPNEKGDACEVLQHSIQLPTYNAFSMPNFPNYRLGPLDGSACDTLDLDNIPVANFRYEVDSLNELSVSFTDLSFYEPAVWSWDFGDGVMSQDTCPVHTYMIGGDREVCLTVSNEYGEDTFCRTLELIDTTTSTSTLVRDQINVYPNPAVDQLTIEFSKPLREKTTWVLYNELGQVVRQLQLAQGIQRHVISLAGLGNGLYFYTLKSKSGLEKTGKVMIAN